MRRYKKAKELSSKFCDEKPYNYFLKIERYNIEGTFPTLFLIHSDSKYADTVLGNHGISNNLVNLVVKFGDLRLRHDYASEIT